MNAVDRLRSWITPPMLVSFVIFGSLPFWIREVGLYPYLGVEVLIFCIYALGYNVLLGYGGLPSFGHGAYFGIGAYAFGLAQFTLSENLWVCLFSGMAAAMFFGAIVALFISHRRGIYFALMTIAFGQMFFFIASKWTSVTKGEDGLLNIARLPVEIGFTSYSIQRNGDFYWFVFACFIVTVILLWRVVNSPFGKVVQAIKQNEARTSFLGYNVVLYKGLVFALSCAVAGFAGSLFAMAQGGAFVQVMNLQWSGVVVLMVLIGGGFVSFWGPVLGVILYFVARDLLGAYTETWQLWFGLLFMLVVMFKPEGLAGIWQGIVYRNRKPRTAASVHLLAMLRAR